MQDGGINIDLNKGFIFWILDNKCTSTRGFKNYLAITQDSNA